jgi:hypothetical protein
MRAKLKTLDLNSKIGLYQYVPESPTFFGLWFNAGIGPDGEEGSDSFQIFVCNFEWLKVSQESKTVIPDRYMIIESEYDINFIIRRLNEYLEKCSGNNWIEIANSISKIGIWEFENYQQ